MAAADCEVPPSMSSAKVGKLSLEYGQFHISGSTTMSAPLLAASCGAAGCQESAAGNCRRWAAHGSASQREMLRIDCGQLRQCLAAVPCSTPCLMLPAAHQSIATAPCKYKPGPSLSAMSRLCGRCLLSGQVPPNPIPCTTPWGRRGTDFLKFQSYRHAFWQCLLLPAGIWQMQILWARRGYPKSYTNPCCNDLLMYPGL